MIEPARSCPMCDECAWPECIQGGMCARRLDPARLETELRRIRAEVALRRALGEPLATPSRAALNRLGEIEAEIRAEIAATKAEVAALAAATAEALGQTGQPISLSIVQIQALARPDSGDDREAGVSRRRSPSEGRS